VCKTANEFSGEAKHCSTALRRAGKMERSNGCTLLLEGLGKIIGRRRKALTGSLRPEYSVMNLIYS